MREVLKISAGDSVAVALVALSVGTAVDVEGQQVVLATDVPAGHKFALKAIETGGSLQFCLMDAPASKLKNTAYTSYFSVE